MLFLANLRRAYKLSRTSYRPTKAFGYVIDSRCYCSKSTSNSKFCKGKKSGKKTKRQVERWKRGFSGKKKLSKNASTLSPVALISDKDTRPTVALIPIQMFEENESNQDAFRDALAVLALLKKKSHQVELFMESYNNLRENSAVEKVMGESPYVTEENEQELDQLDKEILERSAKREKEQSTKGNERSRKHQELNDVPVAGMQLNFELNMTNIRDAILYPQNLKQIRDKPFSDEEASRLVLSTNVHVEPDNKATVPLQLTALIHGTVYIDPTKFSKEKLSGLQVSQFNQYVTAVAASLCSKALQKGFPLNVSRSVYKAEPLGDLVETDKPGSQVKKSKGHTSQSTFEVVDAAELFDGPQRWARLASATNSDQQKSVDQECTSRLDTLISKNSPPVKTGTHQSEDALIKNVVIADHFVERVGSSVEPKVESAGATNINAEAVEINLTKERNEEVEGATGGTKEEVITTEESKKTEETKLLPTDESGQPAGTEVETVQETAQTEKPVGGDDTTIKSQATDVAEPTKGEKEGNVESARKNDTTLAKTGKTSQPTREIIINAQKVKTIARGEGDPQERISKELLLDVQAGGTNAGRRTANVEGTTLRPSDGTEKEGAAKINSAATERKEHEQDRPVEGSSGEASEGKMADEIKPPTSTSPEKNKSDTTSPEIVSKTYHKVDEQHTRNPLPLESNADALSHMINAIELPDSKFQSIPDEKITSSSIPTETDKSEIARQIELSKGLQDDYKLSKYSDETLEFSKSSNELFEMLNDVDQVRSTKTLQIDKAKHPGQASEPNKDEVKHLQRKYYQFKGELYDITTFKGKPSSYAIGLGSAAAIPGKGKDGDKTTKQDPHIVCVRNGSKGCMSPGLAENTFYVPKKSVPCDAGSKPSELSHRGLHQKSLDEASSKKQPEKICTRSSSTTSKSDSGTKKGSVCGSTPPCQNKTKKQQLPPVTKKSSETKCNDPCKRIACKSSKKSDPCKRSSAGSNDPCKISKQSDPCKKSSSESKDACKISKKSDPCKKSSSEFKDPCKISTKSDPCKMSSSESKDPCKISKKSDPCKRSSSESKDPCKITKKSDPCKKSSSEFKDPCKISTKSDPCKMSSSESKDPCKISKKSDPCKRSSSESKDPCKITKKSDLCKRSSSESKDPCKISKKSDPCKKSSSEFKDPCKLSTKADPCKRSSSESKDPCKISKKSDPCKKSSSESKDACKISKKSDPCKKSSSEFKDPCKISTKSDPCKMSSSESKDPCKISKKSDPCKRSSSESKDPCKISKQSDPCKRSSSESKDPCKITKKSDPCKRSSSESKDPCKISNKSDPCKRSSSESKDPCKISKQSDPCKRSASASKDPCKIISKSDSSKSSNKSDPCKKSSSESKDPCKVSKKSDPSKSSNKSDPCKATSPKFKDPCKVSSSSSTGKVDPCKKALSKPKEPCKGQQTSGDVKNQEAIILSPFKICKRTISIKPLHENDVYVCIDSVALSDSDIHMFETGAKKYPGITLGNEASGVVHKVGKKVKHLRAGDHVAIECGVPCGRCSLCRTGHYNLCQKLTFKGCLKKCCTHPGSFCHKISKSVPLPSAALGYQLSLGCNACAQAGIKPNSNVAIIGSCAMTLCTAMCANAMGCSNVCVICTTPNTREVVTKNITQKVQCIDSQTTAQGIYQKICDSLRAPPDVVINCSCSTKTMNASMMALKPNGTCVVSGCLCECTTFNMMDALMKEIRIIPSFRSKNMFPYAVHLLERKQIPIDCIIAECVKWKEIEVGFQKALTENNCGPRKVIVQCQAGEGDDGQKS